MRIFRRIRYKKTVIGSVILFFLLLLNSCFSILSSPRYKQNNDLKISGEFSIMTYNIYGGSWGINEICDVVMEENPDIVCMQETTSSSQKMLDAKLGEKYPYKEYRIGDIGNGPSILSKYPIVKSRYFLSEEGLNGWWVGVVEINSKPVNIINLHLQPTLLNGEGLWIMKYWNSYWKNERIRKYEINNVVQLVDPANPSIILGDFNTCYSAYPIKKLAKRGFVDSFAVCNKNPDSTPTIVNPSIPIKKEYRIDYIFHTKDFFSLSSHVLKKSCSDHYPLISRIGIGE